MTADRIESGAGGAVGSADPGAPQVALLLCTAPVDRAPALADALLAERLVACVNLVGPIASRYVWQGAVEVADETLLLIKTRRALVPEVTARIVALHGYEVPEILELPVAGGLAAYLSWVDASCRR